MEKADREIKGFLYPRMYRHDRVMRVMADAESVVRDLFAHYTQAPADLPQEWGEGIVGSDASKRVRHIADYIAGMTIDTRSSSTRSISKRRRNCADRKTGDSKSVARADLTRWLRTSRRPSR
jgi:dGTP triphosphohydrolase